MKEAFAHTKKPRITYMGEPVEWDEVPEPGAAHPEDWFKKLRLSPYVINQASQLIEQDVWRSEGLYKWLYRRAAHVFGQLPADALSGRMGQLNYRFSYDSDGPVLEEIKLFAQST